jgi:glycine cleavage system H protein
MSVPSNLQYTKDHEWADLSNPSEVVIGITDHAQEALGEVVFVELPKVGRNLKQHETFGVVESIKAVSDLYSPIEGTVVAINEDAIKNPSSINQSAYKEGWLIKIKPTNAPKDLMTAQQYESFVKSL